MARNAGLVDQMGTQCLLRGLEHFWVGLLDTINGIYTCNTVNKVKTYGVRLVHGFPRYYLMPATNYLRLARDGGVYSVRTSWAFGSSHSASLFRVISCIAVRDILQTIASREGEKKIKF